MVRFVCLILSISLNYLDGRIITFVRVDMNYENLTHYMENRLQLLNKKSLHGTYIMPMYRYHLIRSHASMMHGI